MSQGNTKLVEYGIQNEKSDLRVHVCPLAKTVYLFPTKEGIECVSSGRYKSVPVFTGKIQTAQGYLVPPGDIQNCTAIPLSDKTWIAVNLQKNQTTSEKGKKAERLVRAMIKKGLLPIQLVGTEVQDTTEQISGSDIVITTPTAKLQVKCDFRGGGARGVNNCTGNLFLQVQECNPGGHH